MIGFYLHFFMCFDVSAVPSKDAFVNIFSPNCNFSRTLENLKHLVFLPDSLSYICCEMNIAAIFTLG